MTIYNKNYISLCGCVCMRVHLNVEYSRNHWEQSYKICTSEGTCMSKIIYLGDFEKKEITFFSSLSYYIWRLLITLQCYHIIATLARYIPVKFNCIIALSNHRISATK